MLKGDGKNQSITTVRISHKHKFIFVAVPKTGCCSVRCVLHNFSDIESVDTEDHIFRHHTNLRKLKKHFEEEKWDWDNYIKIGGCRNPWDRMVSDYFFQIKVRKERIRHGYSKSQRDPRIRKTLQSGDLTIEGLKSDHLMWKNSTFKDFVLGRNGVGTEGTFSAQSQLFFMVDEKGEMLANYVIRMENIVKDMKTACSLIGIPFGGIPHRNITKHKHYTEYYDDETRQIVAEKYAKDIEHFGYEFGE